MARSFALALCVSLVALACGGGVEAPPVAGGDVVCAANFCVSPPGGWDVVEIGEDFAVFRHPDGGNTVNASVGQVNMELLAESSGRPWPLRTEEVVRGFWELLDGGDAELATVSLLDDGSVRSFGSITGGRLWHRLVPTRDGRAVGVEVRGPNSSWERHADVFLDGLVVDTSL